MCILNIIRIFYAYYAVPTRITHFLRVLRTSYAPTQNFLRKFLRNAKILDAGIKKKKKIRNASRITRTRSRRVIPKFIP